MPSSRVWSAAAATAGAPSPGRGSSALHLVCRRPLSKITFIDLSSSLPWNRSFLTSFYQSKLSERSFPLPAHDCHRSLLSLLIQCNTLSPSRNTRTHMYMHTLLPLSHLSMHAYKKYYLKYLYYALVAHYCMHNCLRFNLIFIDKHDRWLFTS